jgi:demethylmenaquinone methyltransferase / 2-methoxy-6-polyprenyl-1,4-benzoquinol methylase
MRNPEKEWFGDRNVSAEEKTALVRGVFDSVAGKYDLMNDLMSGGLHRLWKDRFVRQVRPRPGLHYLDVAGGTGDIAFRIKRELEKKRTRGLESSNPQTLNSSITICDLDETMLSVGRDRAIDRGWLNDFDWITGNAEALPLPDNSIDVYTIAFGMRNVTHIDTALSEAFRVLKAGGRFYCMEFSHVDEPFLARLYDTYSRNIIPVLGDVVANDRESYQYLIESIGKFPSQKDFARRIERAGFENVRFSNLTFGITSVHTGWKI